MKAFQPLGDQYKRLRADRDSRYMLIRAITIVRMFVIDLLMVFKGMR